MDDLEKWDRELKIVRGDLEFLDLLLLAGFWIDGVSRA